MKQDEALERWIDEDMCDVPCAMPVDEAGEYMCREAWHAAVKHTLEQVAAQLGKEAELLDAAGGKVRGKASSYVRILAADILQMKP